MTRFSTNGMNVGMVVGSQAFLAFTILGQPETWFTALSIGKAIALYGYCGLLWTVACAAIGGWIPSLIGRFANRIGVKGDGG